MNLDKRVYTLEQRTSSVEPVETIEIIGVPCANDDTPRITLTMTIGRDQYFSRKEPME